VIRKSRFAVALVLTLALGVTAIAYADGTSENDASVTGAVTKKKKPKLSPKKFKKVDFMTGVRTESDTIGPGHDNPESEFISFGKNIKFKTGSAPVCTTVPAPGSTPAQARAACPSKSFLGSGNAKVFGAGGTPVDETVVVSAFNGPGANQLQLHTYSDVLLGASPTVLGNIVNSNAGKKYKKALAVESPETGPIMITEFNTNISKSSGVVRARCKAKKFLWRRVVTYDDGTTDTATLSQKCKKKKKKK
jgi:hypothetical protein